MNPLITPAQASSLIQPSPLAAECIPLAQASHRVLAAPLLADRDLPPFSRAMMDGIAFHSTRIDPARVTIAGLHAAGAPPPPPLPHGQAWEIMTGAAVPDECDTVVRYEDLEWQSPADGQAPSVSIHARFTPGQSIHPAASDAHRGTALLPVGTRLGPIEIATTASVGAATLSVFRQPRISIITTGDEAIPLTDTPEAWQIRRSNGAMLVAALSELSLSPTQIEHVADSEKETSAAISRALASSDILIVCGGISMGKLDLVRPVLEARLGPPAFHGVRQKPGKPLAYWPGPPAVFALPGNPVSALATFRRYLIPTLAELQGATFIPALVQVPAAKPLPTLSWLLTVGRAADGSLAPLPPSNSGNFVSITHSIGVIEIPPAPDFTPGQSFHLY